MSRRHEHLLAFLMIVLISVTGVVGAQFATFRVFFSWPYGGTWSNTVAAVEDGALFTFFMWYFRDVLGPRLARWWDRHADKVNEDQLRESLKEHMTSELVYFEERIRRELAAHHERVLGSINGNGSAGGN